MRKPTRRFSVSCFITQNSEVLANLTLSHEDPSELCTPWENEVSVGGFRLKFWFDHLSARKGFFSLAQVGGAKPIFYEDIEFLSGRLSRKVVSKVFDCFGRDEVQIILQSGLFLS